MVFSNMLKNSNSHNFEALAKIIGKLDPRDMAPFDGFPEAAILGDRNLIDSLLRGSRRRHDSELNHNWFDNDNKGPLQALYVEDIILLLRKSNLAEVAVELLEKEIKHIDDAVVSKIYNIKQCGDLLPAILKLKDELYQIISKHSGQSMKKVTENSDRDYWMKAEEAKAYGMVDEVLKNAPK